MKKYKLLICLLSFVFCTIGQVNLVPNQSFEQYSQCPDGADELSYVSNWLKPTTGTPDYFNACFDSSMSWSIVMDIPINYLGTQIANDGNGYCGFMGYQYAANFREYLQAQLNSPMIFGVKYYTTFYVSLADSSSFAIDDIGAYFSNGQINRTDYNAFGFTPQIENIQGNFLSNKNAWIKIAGSYVALGGENYITIGNFKDDSNTDTTIISNFSSNSDYNSAYYYIDNICVSTDSLLCSSINTIQIKDTKNEFYFYYSQDAIFITGGHENAEIEIYEPGGKIILNQKITPIENQIDAHFISTGVYFIRLILKNKTVVNKILINKNQ
ncbi:MAG: T9SS type A sorting domain-containing protein [Bacteroidia bacterium]